MKTLRLPVSLKRHADRMQERSVSSLKALLRTIATTLMDSVLTCLRCSGLKLSMFSIGL